jgi:hypothetical protein
MTSGLCFENGPLRFSPDFQLLGPLFVSDVKAPFAENKKTEASVSFAAAHLMKLTSFFELCSFLIRISSIVSTKFLSVFLKVSPLSSLLKQILFLN